MVAGVLSVGGKSYAVGLYWQVSDTPNATKAARIAARQPGAFADFYCIRSGNTRGRAPQFGLGEARLGHKWFMPSAAASLANRQPGSWAGVFIVSEGVWFIEVRDDLIAPEGDMIFADEAEAMGRLQEASARGGLEKIFAPATWAIPGAESRSLPSLLSGSADARLSPVKIPRDVIKWGIVAAVISAVLVAGTTTYLSMKEKADQVVASEQAKEEADRLRQQQEQQELESERIRQEEEVRRRQEEEERARALAQQMMDAPWYQRVWESTPAPLDWLRACRDTMDKVQISPLGWTLSRVSCQGQTVSVSWSRATGPAVVPDGAHVDSSMRTASAAFALPEQKPRGEERLWPSEAVMLYALYNDWSAQLSYLPDEQPPPLANGQQPPPAPWIKRKVEWSVDLSPWTLKGPFVDIPGLVLDTLVWSSSGNWQIEGVIYEQRK